MLPPQAPPAAVSVANQAAVDTIQRLKDAQRRLDELQADLPEPPLDPDARMAFLAALDAFWQATSSTDAPRSRGAAFAATLASIARDDASLRANDGTLDDDARDAVHTLVAAASSVPPGHLRASEVLVAGQPYAGTLLLRDQRHPERVLLFSAQGGWETFPSAEATCRDVERRLRQELARGHGLPGVTDDVVDPVVDTPFVSTRALDDSVFDTVAARLLQRQREKIESAWRTSSARDVDAQMLAAYEALDLHALVDVHDIVLHRDAALLRHDRQEALRAYPPALASAWIEASDALDARRRRNLEAMRSGAVTNPSTLLAFVRDGLVRRLREQGVDDDPDQLRTTLTLWPGSVGEHLSTAIHGVATETLSLTQLALRNLGRDIGDGLAILDRDGATHTRIVPSTVRALVRDFDAGQRYREHVEAILGDTAQGRRHRQRAKDFLLARLRVDVATTRLAHHDGHRPGGTDGDGTRVVRWAAALVGHLADGTPPSADGHALDVQQLVYRGVPLADVLVIAPAADAGAHGVVVYTPDAPDGWTLRGFADREALARGFTNDRAFEGYLLDRLPARFATENERGVRRFLVSEAARTWQWAFSTTCAFCTRMEEPFTVRRVDGDVADAVYDTAIALARHDVDDLTRSTAQADRDAIARIVRLSAQPLRLPAEAALGLGWLTLESIGELTSAAWRFHDDVKDRRYGQAFVDVVAGYTAALNVVPLYAAAPKAFSGGLMRATRRTGNLIRSRRAIAPAESLARRRLGDTYARDTPRGVAVSPRDDRATASLRAVPESEWPESLYYYATADELRLAHRRRMLVLPMARLADGMEGVPLTTSRPWTPLRALGALRASWYPRPTTPASATLAESGGAWVHVNLRQVVADEGTARLRLFRPVDGDASAFVLRRADAPATQADDASIALFNHVAIQSLSPL